MSRPPFIDDLLKRPLPLLTPPRLSPKQNPPFSEEWRNQIADLKCHPLLESALHLMNDDLFDAHFLLRKMQEDEWGKWLHACLHLAEGDLESNAKLWYEQTDPSVLSTYWDEEDPVKAAVKAMYDIKAVHEQKSTAKDQEQEKRCREIRWKELVAIFDKLEEKFGWEQTDGRQYYTKDESEGHKSNVLGEGWRKF